MKEGKKFFIKVYNVGVERTRITIIVDVGDDICERGIVLVRRCTVAKRKSAGTRFG